MSFPDVPGYQGSWNAMVDAVESGRPKNESLYLRELESIAEALTLELERMLDEARAVALREALELIVPAPQRDAFDVQADADAGVAREGRDAGEKDA